jgi:hypothetical protein
MHGLTGTNREMAMNSISGMRAKGKNLSVEERGFYVLRGFSRRIGFL